jgi:hypothetical protein
MERSEMHRFETCREKLRLLCWITVVRAPAATLALATVIGCSLSAQTTVAVSSTVSTADETHPNGRFEIFAARAGSAGNVGVFHTWENVSGPRWQTPWIRYLPVPDNVPHGLVSGRDGSGRVMVAWLSKGDIYVLESPFPGSSLQQPAHAVLPSPGAGAPKFVFLTVATNADALLELMALDSGGHLWSVKQRRNSVSPANESGVWQWDSPTALGGHALKSVSVTPFRDGRLAAVATGSDGVVYWTMQNSRNGAWNLSWSSLQGHDLVDAVAHESLDHRLEVAALGQDNRIYNRYEPFEVNSWRFLTEAEVSSPVFFDREADGTLMLVFHDHRGDLSIIRQTSPNGSWPPSGQFIRIGGDESESRIEALVSDLAGRHGLVSRLDLNDNDDGRQILFFDQEHANDAVWSRSAFGLPPLP